MAYNFDQSWFKDDAPREHFYYGGGEDSYASSDEPVTPNPDLPQPGTKRFDWSDYLVFALFLVANIVVGLVAGLKPTKEKETAKSYLAGDRNMSVFPVALSILSAFLSAILILGTPAEVYTEGTMYWVYVIGMMLSCVFATLLFVPLLYPLRLTSSYTYLEKRFNHKAPKLVGTIILIIMQLLYMGVALFSPATALEAVTGFPVWASIVIGGVISIIYTALGGIKASVWASVVQSAIMLIGVLTVIIKGSVDLGGFGNVWQRNYDGGRIKFFDFDGDPFKRHSFWTLVVGGTVGWLSTYGVNQAAVQRYSSVPTLKDARATVLLNIPGLFIFVSLCCMMGMVLFAWYDSVGCDPLAAGYVKNPNQLLPFYVMDRLGYPCVPGLFLACLFAGALSSVSSSLSSLAAVFWQDILIYCCGHYSDKNQTIVVKVLVVVFGAAGIGMGFMAQNLGGTVLQASLSFTGAAGGPLLGLFLLAAFFPCANWIGAVVGGIVGLALPLWMSIGAYTASPPRIRLNTTISECIYITEPNMTTPAMVTAEDFTIWHQTTTPEPWSDAPVGMTKLYQMSYLYYPSIGAACVVFFGLLFSCFTGCDDPAHVKAKYHLPFFDWLFCCCPNDTLDVLRCKIAKYDPLKDYSDSEDEGKDEEDVVAVDRNGKETLIPATMESTGAPYIGVEKPPIYTAYDNPAYNDPPPNGFASLKQPEVQNYGHQTFDVSTSKL